MYYFTFQGVDCRCDTADELCAVVGQKQSTSHKSTTAGATGAARSKATTARTRRKKAKKAKKANPRDAEIRKLPYVEEGLSWDVVKKVAATLGREDIKQLRMDLKTRKDMGK